jgi:hypothetical protein
VTGSAFLAINLRISYGGGENRLRQSRLQYRTRIGVSFRCGGNAGLRLQNTTLMTRMISSSGEKIVSKRGKRGTNVAAAKR